MAVIPAWPAALARWRPAYPPAYISTYISYLHTYLHIYMADIMDFAKNPSEMALCLPISLYTVLYLDTYLWIYLHTFIYIPIYLHGCYPGYRSPRKMASSLLTSLHICISTCLHVYMQRIYISTCCYSGHGQQPWQDGSLPTPQLTYLHIWLSTFLRAYVPDLTSPA